MHRALSSGVQLTSEPKHNREGTFYFQDIVRSCLTCSLHSYKAPPNTHAVCHFYFLSMPLWNKTKMAFLEFNLFTCFEVVPWLKNIKNKSNNAKFYICIYIYIYAAYLKASKVSHKCLRLRVTKTVVFNFHST